MVDDDCSRRDFLKRFAVLSVGTLALTAPTLACYGPGPGYGLQYPTVSGMYFLDGQGRTMSLPNNQSVPLQTKFTIEFTDDMNTSGPATVFLSGPADAPVSYNNKVWETVRILTLTPEQNLASATLYTLRMGDDAEDARGDKITITETATAVFKTTGV